MLRLLAVSSIGLAIVGYCIYFDKKRRMDPDYKRKVHERRERQKASAKVAEKNNLTNNFATMHKLFLEGRMDEVVMQLFTILQYSERPQDVLSMWYKCLPKEIFAQLIDVIGQKGGLPNSASSLIKNSAEGMSGMSQPVSLNSEDVD